MPKFESRSNKFFLCAFVVMNFMIAANSFGRQDAEQQLAAAPILSQDASREGQEGDEDSESKTAGIRIQSDGKVRFKFVDAPWSEVIEFFAKEAGFSLQPMDAEPEGTFKYNDDQDYTVMEALDQLNYALALRGFTLVRNKRLLILVSTERNIPDDLIETVKPSELDGRGKHEILKCVFDLEGLEDANIGDQIENLISREHNDAFHILPAAKQMIVREKGQSLRTIRDVLEAARTQLGESRFTVRRHRLEHIDPESVLEAARVLLDLDDNNQSPDGQFKVMVQPLSTELIFRGSPTKVKQFEALIAQLDIASDSANTTAIERPTLKQYAVSGDLEMAFKIIQTMMANRDVRFDIDRSTGRAILLGREDDHRRLAEILAEMSAGGDDFAVVELKNITTAKAMTILEQLYQRDSTSDEKTPIQGPVFFPDETYERLIVKGTPQEVAAVRRYIEQLDVHVDLNTGPRSKTRIVTLDGSSVTPDLVEDLFSTTGRQNRLQIVMPKNLRPRGAFNEFSQPVDEPVEEQPPQPPQIDNSKKSGWNRLPGAFSIAGFRILNSLGSNALVTWQDPKTDEPMVQDEPPSVPGADIEVKITEYGIVLRSDDLDALDEMESLLKSRFEDLSASDRPAVFYLKYRDPKDAKNILEKLIGQGGKSSGAADPLSSLIGAGVNNMIPGMGDLFGGGASSSASSGGAVFEMDGPVVIMADSELRALIVGASARDMDVIAPLITDYIDQPGAPHDPKIQGEFYSIPVVHRDPAELKTTLEAMLPDIIRTEADQNQAGPNQGPEQQILQRLMQARGGQQTAEEEQKSPKAVLGVDEKSHALLVSGPPFIYEQILKIVQKLDSPELSQSSYVIMPLDGRNAELIARSLKASLGDKIEITSPATTSAGANSQPGATASPQANPLGAQQAQQQAEARNAMFQALQQMNRSGQRQQNNRGNQGGRGGPGSGPRGGQSVPGNFRGNPLPGGG